MTKIAQPRDAECRAYLSTLLTVELCAELHKHDKPNAAVRRCIGLLLPGIAQFDRTSKIFAAIALKPFPLGSLHSLRRHLEEMAGGKVTIE